MANDFRKLAWATEVRDHLDLGAVSDDEGRRPEMPRPGGSFDRDKAFEALRENRCVVPREAEMPDEAIRFWFWAATELSQDVEEAIDELRGVDLSEAPSAEVVEKRFNGLFQAQRWDIPRVDQLMPILPRLIGWDEVIRLIVETGQHYYLDDMFDMLPTAESCGASEEARARGRAHVVRFVEGQQEAGSREVGAALALAPYPDGVRAFFEACKRRYGKWVATYYGAPLLPHLDTPKEAYKLAKRFKLALPGHRIRALIERFGFEDCDLLVEACAKSESELRLAFGIRSYKAVPGWLGLLKKPALVDYVEHFLLTEGANAIEGMVKLAARRGAKRDAALSMLQRVVEAGHEALVRELTSDETAKIKEVIEARVFAADEDAIPQWPEEDWSDWAKQVATKRSARIDALRPAQLPTVHTSDGAYRVPEQVMVGLASQAAMAKTPAAQAELLRAAVEDLNKDEAGRFAWAFFERWYAPKVLDKTHLWVLALIEHLGGRIEAAELGATLGNRRWQYRIRPKAMRALQRMAIPEALTGLLRVSDRWATARSYLEEVQKAWGCEWEEFLDRIVPECGLNALHCLELDFGERKPIAALVPPSKLVIVDRGSGDVFQKLPPKRKTDDAARYNAAREQYKALRKSLSKVIEEQVPRLERAMISDRRFEREHWVQHVCGHAVIGPMACTLVWKTLRDGEWVTFMPTHPDDTCIDANYDEVQLGEEIALAHPADLTPEDKAAWSEVIADSEIVQPFDQLARLALKPGSPEAKAELERLATDKKTDYDMRNEMYQRGWSGEHHKSGKGYHRFRRVLGRWEIVAEIKPILPSWSWPPSDPKYYVKGLYFETKNPKGELTRAADDEVPPVIFSETLRSLLLPPS